METTNRSDHLIINTSKSGIPTKHQLADKLEAQTGVKFSAKTINHLLKERIQMEKKSEKPFGSEKNRLPRLSSAREHISGNIDEWGWILLNPTENLWAELD